MSLLVCSAVFFPMTAAIVGYLIGRKDKDGRDYFVFVVSAMEVVLFLSIFIITTVNGSVRPEVVLPGICGMGIRFKIDGFRVLYGSIAAFMWFVSAIFSREYFGHYRNRNRYYLFLLLTLGATEGVFLSADFYTTFIFFEMMSFTSYVWVAHDEKKESMSAANTYLAVAVIGGLVMLMGLFLLYSITGTLEFEELTGLSEGFAGNMGIWVAGICMLFGFGAKAGAFPLHIWLPKAHPVAPAPASALLSGILTKAGMFGILVLTCYIFLNNSIWGSLILVIGVCTMAFGAVLALFSVDLKRTLACSSVSQIGFILVGVGMSGLLGEENVLALRGSLLHMVNHSLIKLVRFMAAGVVFMNVHKLDLNAIRGFGRKKPLLNYIFLMGALGIGGVPLWNGYISKTLIHESIVEYLELMKEGAVQGIFTPGSMKGIEWIFLVSGGLTAAYMMKLYTAVFLEKNNDEATQEKFDTLNGKYMNKASAAVLVFSATLLPVMGFLPEQVMGRMADMGQVFLHGKAMKESVAWFSITNLKGGAISLSIGIVLYLTVVRLWLMKKEVGKTVYVNRWYRYLDLEDIIYRPLLLKALPFVFGVLCRILDSFVDTIVVLLRKTIYRDSKLPHELEEGTPITHAAGVFMNSLEKLANATIWRKHPRTTDHEHKYAMLHEELSEDGVMIGRSLSFALLLFCFGLVITVIYLLL